MEKWMNADRPDIFDFIFGPRDARPKQDGIKIFWSPEDDHPELWENQPPPTLIISDLYEMVIAHLAGQGVPVDQMPAVMIPGMFRYGWYFDPMEFKLGLDGWNRHKVSQ